MHDVSLTAPLDMFQRHRMPRSVYPGGNGAIGFIQIRFVAVGISPGIEARVNGSKGALIWRTFKEHGVTETLEAA